jgi:PmbA protein
MNNDDAAALADRAAAVLGDLKLEAEFYLEDTMVSAITVASGKVESLEMKEECGAGIRIFDGGRVGFAYTSDLSRAGVRDAASAARSLAAHADADAANHLPRPDPPPGPTPPDGDRGIAKVEVYRKTALARAMEEAARGVDPRITKVREARYGDVVGQVEVRNTSGFARGGGFARVYGSIAVVAEEDGSSQAGYASDYAVRFTDLDPFRIGREAAHRAVDKLGGGRPATCTADIVFDPEAAGNLLEAFSPVFSADQVLKGKSFLAGRLGSRVAAGSLSVVDDGRFPGANRTFPFDGEGLSTGRTVLVENGVLKGFLHNAQTAEKMGATPTGNAVRSSYMSLPRVGPTTLYLVPSARSAAEILGAVQDGFHITELMGLHTLDPVTGEFSLGASGRRIREGCLGDPVSGVGLAGTVARFLGNVAAVGSDLRLRPGATAGSTTLVSGLSISGT